MSVAKPTKVPRFGVAADNVTIIAGHQVEPSSGTKDTGYIPSQKPPSQEVNWLFYTIYTWILWLQDITNQALNWAALQTFLVGVVAQNSTVNGHGIQSTGNGSGSGVIGIGGASDGTGVSGSGAVGHNGDGGRFVASGVGKGLRCTAGSASAGGEAALCTGLLLGTACHAIACVDGYALLVEQNTTGAVNFDHPAARIVASDVCKGLEVVGGSGGGKAATFDSGNNASRAVVIATRGVSSHTALEVFTEGDGAAILIGVGNASFVGANAPAVSIDPGSNNLMHADLIPKAWGYIKITGPTAAGYPNSTNLTFKGSNIASVVYTNNQTILVTLVRGMSDADYAVTVSKSASASGTPTYILDPLTVTSTTFKIQPGNGSTGSYDTTAFTALIAFQVFGHQS